MIALVSTYCNVRHYREETRRKHREMMADAMVGLTSLNTCRLNPC